MSAEQNLAIVQDIYAAFARGDLAAVLAGPVVLAAVRTIRRP